MEKIGTVTWVRRTIAHAFVVLVILVGSAGWTSRAASSVTLGWDPSPETGLVAGYRVYHGSISRGYSNVLTVANTTQATVTGLVEGVTYYFAVTTLANSGLESDYSTELVFVNTPSITNTPNQPPTLNPIANRNINENVGLQTVNLTGITSGNASENQFLTVTATSSNPALIPNPTVNYTSPNTSGFLTFTPASYGFGFANITVTVSDGQAQNGSISRTFYVVVNDRPFISAIYDQFTVPDAPTTPFQFTVFDTETPASNLVLSATSSAPGLLPQTNIVFGGNASNRTMTLTPVPGRSGTSVVSVAVSDGSATSTTTFRFIVDPNSSPNPPATTPPVISSVPNLTLQKNTTSAPIPLAVWDAETPSANLTLQGNSSLPSLVPDSGIVFGGSGSNRTVTIIPAANQTGETTIAITVDDGGAVATSSFRVRVVTTGQALVEVRRNGQGQTIASYGTQPPMVGSTYTITALPDAGHVFTGWSGSITSAAPRLSFVAAQNMVLEANFAPASSTPVAGDFDGLFREQSAVRPLTAGFFALKTTGKGSYSGRLHIGKDRRSFRGNFGDGPLQATNHVVMKDGRSLSVEFSVIGEPGDRIVGRVTDGSWESSLTAQINSDGTANQAATAGNYTLVLPGRLGASNAPAGHSYATVNVSRKGLAKFTGTLSDGTRCSQSAHVSKTGVWPLYAALYSGQGLVLSWLNFTNRANDDLHGTVHWINPPGSTDYASSGFAYSLEATGSAYQQETTPLPGQNAHVSFRGGDLGPGFTNLVSLDTGKFENQGQNPLTLKLSRNNGLFQGKVTDPTSGASYRFGGVVLQKQNAGYGFLSGSSRASEVTIRP